jgi:hypothetical protein
LDELVKSGRRRESDETHARRVDLLKALLRNCVSIKLEQKFSWYVC